MSWQPSRIFTVVLCIGLKQTIEGLDSGYYVRCWTDNQIYYFSAQLATWQQAQTECRIRGGDLLYINNAAENNFITTELAKLAPNKPFWIGLLMDCTATGCENLRWSSGHDHAYDNPFLISPIREVEGRNFVYMVHNNTWVNMYGDRKYQYICGFEKTHGAQRAHATKNYLCYSDRARK